MQQKNKNKILEYLLYFAAFLIPFYFFRFSIFGLRTNVFEVAVLLAFVVFILTKSLSFTIYKMRWGSYLPCLFLIAVFASAILSSDFEKALGIFKGWFLIPIIYYWLIINVFDRKDITKLSIPIFISLIVISIWALLQKIGIIGALFYQKGDASFDQYLSVNFRIFGPFESPNYLAMYLVPAIFLSLLVFDFTKEKIYKSLLGFLFLLPFIALILSGSRAGIIAFIIGCLIYLIFGFKDKDKVVVTPILKFSLIFSLLAGFFVWIFLVGLNPASDSVRIEIYKYSWQILKDNWIFGIGLGEFQNTISEITKNVASFRTHALPYALHPHNIFLAMWLNLGLAGLVLFVWILVDLFRNIFKINSPVKMVLLISAIAILIHGLFDTTYYKNDLSAMFWLIFAFSGVLTSDKK